MLANPPSSHAAPLISWLPLSALSEAKRAGPPLTCSDTTTSCSLSVGWVSVLLVLPSKIYRHGSTKACETPNTLLPTKEGRQIVWSKRGFPQGHWKYYEVQEGSDVSEEMYLCFSASEKATFKEHYFRRIPGTSCWGLMFEKGTHNHMHHDTVLLIKSEENHDAT